MGSIPHHSNYDHYHFLILDQPSQVYFPSYDSYKALDGEMSDLQELGADVLAVRRMFTFLFDVVEQLKPNLQIIVLEHANFTLLFYGISRSVTHELVRHRAGFGFSQLSQRYVSGKVLRFVERPEYVNDQELHELFVERIDRAAADYERIAEGLVERQKAGVDILSGEAKTDLRKKVQQAARAG